MKTRFFFFISLLYSTTLFSQSFYSDFEDGTLQGWTNYDGDTLQLTVEGASPNLYLQKECDGSNSTVGEMTIINTTEWAGNYFYEAVGDLYLINIDEIFMKNDNDFDLHLRYGFTGANGYMVVTTDPIIVPAFSDWDIYLQYYNIDYLGYYNLTVLNDTTGIPNEEVLENVHELFEDVVEFRIFHNEDTLMDGQNVTGTLQISNIFSYLLLSDENFNLANVQLYPNPVKSKLYLETPSVSTGSITFYNVIGKEVLTKEVVSITTQLDLSELKSGIYLAKIQTESQSIIKKIVKL